MATGVVLSTTFLYLFVEARCTAVTSLVCELGLDLRSTFLRTSVISFMTLKRWHRCADPRVRFQLSTWLRQIALGLQCLGLIYCTFLLSLSQSVCSRTAISESITEWRRRLHSGCSTRQCPIQKMSCLRCCAAQQRDTMRRWFHKRHWPIVFLHRFVSNSACDGFRVTLWARKNLVCITVMSCYVCWDATINNQTNKDEF